MVGLPQRSAPNCGHKTNVWSVRKTVSALIGRLVAKLLLDVGVNRRQDKKLADCQADCHAGGLRRILVNRTDTRELDLNTGWTLVSLYEHLDSALENC